MKIDPAAGSSIGITTDNDSYSNTDESNLTNPLFNANSSSTLLNNFKCLDQGYKLVVDSDKKVYKAALPALNITAGDDKLKGFTEGEKYTVSYTVDENTTSAEITPTGTDCDINDEWYGKTISIVKNGNGSYIADSKAQELTIPAKARVSDAATAEVTKFEQNGNSTSVGLSVKVSDNSVSNITVKIGGKAVMSYPADNGSVEAGKTVNFGILVCRVIEQSAITVEVDGEAVAVTQKQ